jgi:putative transcriptional regulator
LRSEGDRSTYDLEVRSDPKNPDFFELPDFVREAGVEPAAQTAEALGALAALSRAPVSAEARARLLAQVRELPLRYGPFFGALGELWDLPEEKVSAVLTEAREPRNWQWTILRGVRQLEVAGGPRTAGARVRLLKFAPGVRFPRHRHQGLEHVLVLEGSYTDSKGHTVGPGELQVMDPGSEHDLHVDRGQACVAGLVQFGMEFTGPVLRWVSKLGG